MTSASLIERHAARLFPVAPASERPESERPPDPAQRAFWAAEPPLGSHRGHFWRKTDGEDSPRPNAPGAPLGPGSGPSPLCVTTAAKILAAAAAVGVVISPSNPWHPDRVQLRASIREALAAAYEDAAGALESDLELTPVELVDLHDPATSREDVTGALARARSFRRKASNIRACGWEKIDSGGVLVRKADGAIVVDSDNEPRVYGQRCSVRWCPACARSDVRRRRKKLAPLLDAEGDAADFVMLTLTRTASSSETFAEAFDALTRAFDALRKSRDFKTLYRAGLAGIEATYSTKASRLKKARAEERRAAQLEHRAANTWDPLRNAGLTLEDLRDLVERRCLEQSSGAHWYVRGLLRDAESARLSAARLRASDDSEHWHAHIHLVLSPRLKPENVDEREWLRVLTVATWAEALGVERDECNVWLEKPAKALPEVVKYALKGIDVASMPRARLVEVLTHLEGRKLVRVIGEWYGNRAIRAAVAERMHETPEVDEKNLGTDDSRAIGFALGTDDKVTVAEVEIRFDDDTRQRARVLKAIQYEVKRRDKSARYEPPPTETTAPAMPPAPLVPARPFKLRTALPATVDSVGDTTRDLGAPSTLHGRALSKLPAADFRALLERAARQSPGGKRRPVTGTALRALACTEEEARIGKRFRRSSGVAVDIDVAERPHELIDADGFFVRFISDDEAEHLVETDKAEEVWSW